jgi:uncharacterized protein YggE
MEFDDNLNPVRPEAPAPQPPTPQPQPSWTPPTPPPHQEPPKKKLHFHQGATLNGMTTLVYLLLLVAVIGGGFYLVTQRDGNKPNTGISGAQEGLSVSAEGLVYATPDIAKLRFGVQQTGKDAAVTESDLSKKIDAIKSKLKELGIEDKDIKTVEFGIYPDYGIAVPSSTTKPRSYNGRHILEVTIRDLDKADEVARAVVVAGANEVQNVYFTVEDPESWYQQARTQAITKAKEKAKQLAQDADIKLGRLLSINEYTNGGPIYYGRDVASPEYGGIGMGGDVATGVEPGNLELRANVTLVYQIR